MLAQFEKIFDEVIYADDEKGFSQKPQWLEYRKLITKLNTHIKADLKTLESDLFLAVYIAIECLLQKIMFARK